MQRQIAASGDGGNANNDMWFDTDGTVDGLADAIAGYGGSVDSTTTADNTARGDSDATATSGTAGNGAMASATGGTTGVAHGGEANGGAADISGITG